MRTPRHSAPRSLSLGARRRLLGTPPRLTSCWPRRVASLPNLLERLARPDSPSPTAARRACALLGDGDGALDAVDLAVVRAIRDRATWSIVTRGETTEAGPWGLDQGRSSVWLANSRDAVAFGDRALLFRVLVALAERGGRASKEDLVGAVWNERVYHPLHHDNRLRLAVRKIRQSLEDSPEAPVRVGTTDDGYELLGRVRWLRERS